jgi:glutamine synthetase
MATELEFFLFEKSFDDMRKGGFRDLEPISGYNEDYHILQTTKEEAVMRPCATTYTRRASRSKIPRARPKRARKNSTSANTEALNCAEYHTIAKHAVKEIAWAKGPLRKLPCQVAGGQGRLVDPHSPVDLFDKDGKTPSTIRPASTACPS